MKKSFAFSLTVFFALILTLMGFPCTASAQTGTEENEQLSLTAVYFDEQGKRADGNVLTAGNYRMELVLSGFAQISEMEFTASYDNSITVNGNTAICDVADASADISSLCRINDGSIIICLVSLNDDCSSIVSDRAVIFSADITVSSSVPLDMDKVITENENPNYTFIEKDYGEIDKTSVPYVYDCYGFAESKSDNYAGTVTDMLFDMSPELPKSYPVKGKVVAMLNPSSPDDVTDAPALSDVEVKINDVVVATTNSDGVFEIPSLENGTHEAVLHYANGFDRKIVIIVNDESIDYTDKPITMVSCDYDNNGRMNGIDKNIFNLGYKLQSYGSDLDGNTRINGLDKNIFNSFYKISVLSDIYTSFVIC